jgi:hypothetical protein
MPESVVVSQIAWDASFFLLHITPISVYRSTIKSKFAKKRKLIAQVVRGGCEKQTKTSFSY